MVTSGRFGMVNGISRVRNWSINRTTNQKTYAASNTGGGMARRAGVNDWSGNFAIFGGAPAVMPGEVLAFAGYTGPDDEMTEGGSGRIYTGDTRVAQIQVAWNWESGDILQQSVSFEGNGELTIESDTMTLDNATPPESTGDCKIVAVGLGPVSGGGDPTDLEICDLVSAQLQLSAALKPYANSCTDGWMARKAGPIDGTFSLVIQNHDLDDLDFALNDDVHFKAYVSNSTYWDLKWMRFTDVSNIQVDRESGNIIQFTANFGFQARVGVDLGYIKKPDTTTFFPLS